MEEKTKILSPTLKVRQRSVSYLPHVWKVWWNTHEPTRYRHRARLEGPAVIYQDGSIVWRQP